MSPHFPAPITAPCRPLGPHAALSLPSRVVGVLAETASLAAPCCCFLSSTARVAASSPGVAPSIATSAAPRSFRSPPLQAPPPGPLSTVLLYIQYLPPSPNCPAPDGRVKLRVCCWTRPPDVLCCCPPTPRASPSEPPLRAACCPAWPTAPTTPLRTCPVASTHGALRRARSPSPSSPPHCPPSQRRPVSRCRARPRVPPSAMPPSRLACLANSMCSLTSDLCRIYTNANQG
jgi:hypothetical protein